MPGPLNAYAPLEQVYEFHEAERWVLRRYAAQVVAQPGAERRRGAWAEVPVEVFPDRSGRQSVQGDPGQSNPDLRTVYTRTRVRLTNTATQNVQPTDVLFDPEGAAWQATADGRWDEARGYAVELRRAGQRGRAPW